MKTLFSQSVSFLVLLVGCVAASFSQGKSAFVMNVDYARFRYSNEMGYLELYYGFYPKLLTYNSQDGKLRGGIKLKTTITSKSQGTRLLEEAVLVPITASDSNDATFRYTYVAQAGYSLPFGEYLLSVQAADSLDPTRRDSTNIALSIVPFPSGSGLSDLELCSKIQESTDKSDSFYKNSMTVFPNPTLVFGASSTPVLFCYSELYNIIPESTYAVKTKLLDSQDKVVRESTKNRRYSVKNAAEVSIVNMTSIPSGRYRFQLSISDGSGLELMKSEKTLFVYNSHVAVPAGTLVSAKANELAGLSGDELSEEFRKISYYATEEESRTFSAMTGADGKREFLSRLWTDVERGKGRFEPVTRTEYLRRAVTADDRYRALGKEGWRTERGRVFMLYGEPDEVERFPSSGENKPYEIWRYFRTEGGVDFVFVDRSLFGEYILVHSTKRGELRDDDWQRYLK